MEAEGLDEGLNLHKGFEDGGTPVGAGAGAEGEEGRTGFEAGAPRGAVAHDVEGFADSDDAGRERNGFALEALGVAGAIPAFMVGSDAGESRGERGDLFEDVDGGFGVATHLGEFLVGEGAEFAEGGSIETDFADVVEEGGVAEGAEGGLFHAEALTRGDGVDGGSLGVLSLAGGGLVQFAQELADAAVESDRVGGLRLDEHDFWEHNRIPGTVARVSYCAMQPPPFETHGMPVQKKKSPLPWIILGGVVVCCIGPILASGAGLFALFKGASPMVGCTIAMTGLSRAMEDYAKANGGKLPPAASWQSAIAPYYDKSLKGEDAGPFKIPQSNAPFACDDSAKTAIAFNTAFSGKKLADIKDREDAIILFETNGAPVMNKAEAYKDPGMANSPKIFNAPRGWMGLNANFRPVQIQNGRQSPMGSGMGSSRANR